MKRKNNLDPGIQAVVVDIRLKNIIHITVEKVPILNVPYIIRLDDSPIHAERYALYTARKLHLIKFLFPETPSELNAAATSDHIQRFYIILTQFRFILHVFTYSQIGFFQ